LFLIYCTLFAFHPAAPPPPSSLNDGASIGSQPGAPGSPGLPPGATASRSRLPRHDPGSVTASLLSALFQSIDAFVRVSLAKRKPCPRAQPEKPPYRRAPLCSFFYPWRLLAAHN